MDDILFGIAVFVVICVYITLAYFIWQRKRMLKKGEVFARPHHVIGEVESINFDENGISITGKLNDHGKALNEAGLLDKHFTAGFTNLSGGVDVDGTRIIREARLQYVSLDAEPGPYGGKIEKVDYVGTQPGDKDA